MRVIAISGKMGVGKSTVAKAIHGADITPIANALKEAVREGLLEAFYAEDDPYVLAAAVDDKPTSPEMRVLLQTFGAFVRSVNPNVLIDTTIHGHRWAVNDVIVIDDLRYPNELEALREEYGDDLITVRLNKAGDDWVEPEHADHHSETSLDDVTDWDIVLHSYYGQPNVLVENAVERINARL